jgi:CAAX protease family protein
MNSSPDPAPRQLPLSAGDLLLILIFGLGAVRIFGAIIVISLGMTDPNREFDGTSVLIVTVVLVIIQAVALLLVIWAIVIRKRGLPWSVLGLRPSDRRWYVRGVAIGILLVPTVGVVNYIMGQIQGTPFENPQVYAIAPAGFSWPGLIVMTLAAGVVAPYAEEIGFRGLFFPWLRERIGLIAGVVISALFFASLHGVLQLVPSLAIIGATLAVLYHRCGSIYPVMVAHGVFNAIMVIALYSALAGTTAPA